MSYNDLAAGRTRKAVVLFGRDSSSHECVMVRNRPYELPLLYRERAGRPNGVTHRQGFYHLLPHPKPCGLHKGKVLRFPSSEERNSAEAVAADHCDRRASESEGDFHEDLKISFDDRHAEQLRKSAEDHRVDA